MNQLTQRSGVTLTYDAKGNLTGDGTNTYTWNTRNQLVSISGGVSASFQYEGATARYYLLDGVASTVAMLDGSGAIQTEYTYEPFGKTTVCSEISDLVQFMRALTSDDVLRQCQNTIRQMRAAVPF